MIEKSYFFSILKLLTVTLTVINEPEITSNNLIKSFLFISLLPFWKRKSLWLKIKVLNNNSLTNRAFYKFHYITKCVKKQGGDYLKREWLIEKRKIKKISQEDLANKCEVSQVTIARIEAGERRPSPELAKKIADVLNFSWTKFYED